MATPVEHYAVPGWRVALDVIRFAVDERGEAVFDARFTLLAGRMIGLSRAGATGSKCRQTIPLIRPSE